MFLNKIRKITLDKILEYSVYLVVFLLPLQTRWMAKLGELNGGYWEYGTYSLYFIDILILLIFFLFVAIAVFNRKFSIFNFQFSIKRI